MSIFGKLLKTTFDVATMPVDILKDVVALGDILTDEKPSSIREKGSKLVDDITEIRDEIDKI